MKGDEKGASRRGVARVALFLAVLATAPAAAAAEPAPAGGDLVAWALPDEVTVVARRLDGSQLDLFLEDHHHRWQEDELEALVHAALEDAFDQGLGVTGVIPWARRESGWVPVVALLPPVPPVPVKPWEPRSFEPGPEGPVRRSIVAAVGARRRGALSGKVVYISAGHGFTWDPSLGRWVTQRGNTNDIVEDLVSAEAVDQLMTTYLENAGATVFTVRERDMNPNMVIVDAEAGATTSTEGEGSYSERGSGWRDSVSGGYRAGLAPYVDGDNPFALGESRVAEVAPGGGATARWAFEVPTPGRYRVYAAWVAGSNRAPDAHYTVEHAGGVSRFRVDQRRHGSTWMSLGQFYFHAGGAVELHNDSDAAGSYVSADAIRVGGGMGDAARGDGGPPPSGTFSGRPRWEENARYHIQFTGAPESVYNYASSERSDDVGARSRYAAWQNETGEDAVYVSWHTNAPDGGHGTSTFVYGPNPPDGNFDFTGTPGSDRLGRFLQDELINDFRAAIDPDWHERGLFTAYFGELNKNHNPEMPSALAEVAFHATASDAEHLKQPLVRQVAARAFYQAVARYFADRDGHPVQLSPEPPEEVRAVAVAPDRVRVSWRAAEVDRQELGGHAATGFRLYRSADGLGWDDGTDVMGDSHELPVTSGAPTFFRVSAFNDGGESLPSPLVAASPPPCDGGDKALIVYGFYRLDSGLAPREDLSAYRLDVVVRMRLAEMNRFDGVVAHAWALARAGIAFDSTEAPALTAERLSLDPYRLVDWVLGEESTADETLSAAEQALIDRWRGPGRTLLVSGAELAWDLGERGSEADRAFLASLGVAYAADDAGTYDLSWDGGSLELDDGTLGTFDVNYPDVLSVVADGEVVLRYADGRAAGVVTRDAGGAAMVFGVPLEAVHPESGRDALVASLVAGSDLIGGGCGVEPGPEATVEPVEVIETAEPDATVPAVDGGAAAGRVHREVQSSARKRDGGCVSSGAGSFVSWPMTLALLIIALRSLRARARKRRDGRALVF